MTQSPGMWRRKRLQTFVKGCLSLLALSLSCCTWPFHGPSAPSLKGVWVGDAHVEKFVDDKNVPHEYVTVKIVHPPKDVPVEKVRKELILPLDAISKDHPIYLVLSNDKFSAIDASLFEYMGDTIQVLGVVKYHHQVVDPENSQPAIPLYFSQNGRYKQFSGNFLVLQYESYELIK